MAHIENIFICITVPLLISLFFIKGKQRSFTMFICIGMSICMASAYVNSFFMTMYGADAVSTAIQIAPVCEEIMKLLPLLFFILIFEPRPGEIIPAAIAIAAGFATFENVCYLSENGAGDIALLLVRGGCRRGRCISCAELPWDTALRMCLSSIGLRRPGRLGYLERILFFMRYTICW